MSDALATATYWAPVLETIADAAFAVVIVALAVELVSGRIAKRFEHRIDADRELKIAELNKETEQLRQLAGPRLLNHDVFVKELEGKPKPKSVAIWYLPDVPDAWAFALRLQGALINAGWPIEPMAPAPESPKEVVPWRDVPRTMVAGAQPSGVTVVGGTINMEEPWFKALFEALVKSTTFGIYGSGGSQYMPVPPGTLRVVVAAKSDPIFVAPPGTTPTK
jgi:hypothetical protein